MTTDQSVREPLTRESLHKAVWRTPMRTLAFRYGCSDRGLAKLCERFRIPVPPRGYWARLAAGQRVHRVRLPALSDTELKALGLLELPVPQSRKPKPHTEAARVAETMKSAEGRIQVREDLRGAHPLVRKTRELFEGARADERGILHPDRHGQNHLGGLAIHVSEPSIHRALRIADALIKAVEARGWTISCPARSWERGTGIGLLGMEVPVAIEELVKRVEQPKEPRRVTKGLSYNAGHGPYVTLMTEPYPRYRYETLGRLALRVPSYGSPDLQIADGTTRLIEERLDDFLVGIVRIAERSLERRRTWEAEAARRLEAQRRDEEIARQRAEEASRLAALRQQAAMWREAEDIRAYIKAIREQSPDPNEEQIAYLNWALRQADVLDPLTSALASTADSVVVD